MVELTTDWFLRRFGGKLIEIQEQGAHRVVQGTIFAVRVRKGLLEIELQKSSRRTDDGLWVAHTQLDFAYVLQSFHPKLAPDGTLILSSGVTGEQLQFFP